MKAEDITFSSAKGFIEEFDKDVSYNIYRGTYGDIDAKFYRSCYKLDTAIKILLKLPPKKDQPKQFKFIKSRMRLRYQSN